MTVLSALQFDVPFELKLWMNGERTGEWGNLVDNNKAKQQQQNKSYIIFVSIYFKFTMDFPQLFELRQKETSNTFLKNVQIVSKTKRNGWQWVSLEKKLPLIQTSLDLISNSLFSQSWHVNFFFFAI